MSIYFPSPRREKLCEGIESDIFDLNNKSRTRIMLSTIASGAKVAPHAHAELQMGLAIRGRFMMRVNGLEKILEPLKNAYFTENGILHSAENCFKEEAIGLDIKCLDADRVNECDDMFLELTKEVNLSTGIKMQFFVSPWCEIMVSEIPKGAVMPVHHHKNEQIGVAVSGKYIMQVGDEEELFEYGKIYYAPPDVPHGAYNPYDEMAVSLNIFTPSRYNKPRKYERAKR